MKRFVKKKKKIIHEKEQKRSELVPFHFIVILVCMLPALLSGLWVGVLTGGLARCFPVLPVHILSGLFAGWRLRTGKILICHNMMNKHWTNICISVALPFHLKSAAKKFHFHCIWIWVPNIDFQSPWISNNRYGPWKKPHQWRLDISLLKRAMPTYIYVNNSMEVSLTALSISTTCTEIQLNEHI